MKYSISTEKELDERFWQIPEDLQDVIVDEKTRMTTERIGTEHRVVSSLLWQLNSLTCNILMAVDPIKGFSQRIAQLANIPTTTAQKIADEINENIFRPVRESLILIHEIPQSEQAEIPAVETHFEHLLEVHSPGKIALTGDMSPRAATATPTTPSTPAASQPTPFAPTFAPKTLAEQKMSRPTSLPPQISRTNTEPDPYREAIN